MNAPGSRGTASVMSSEHSPDPHEDPLGVPDLDPVETHARGEILPVLPLLNTVLLPGIIKPLLATSDRAQRLIAEAAAVGELIVGVAARDPDAQDPGPDHLYGYGCVARILRPPVEARREARGEGGPATQRVYVKGLQRVRIDEYVQETPYLRARVTTLGERAEPSVVLEALQRNVQGQFLRLSEGSSTVTVDARSLVSNLDDPSVLSDQVAAHMSLALADRQELLEMTDVRLRLERLSEHLAREAEVQRLEREVREEVQEELSRSQREYVLREQARAIRRQLGEADQPADQLEELRARIERAGMPEEARARADSEFERLSSLPPGAMEAGTIRTYLDWLVELPWSRLTDDALDVAVARKVLDEDHYDLEKVKERVLEFIAVARLKRDLRGPILCFVGPPGTGKTSLGRSIARAMGREFARLSLGGVRDEAEIRGHRRTYIGALPGRVIQTLKRVGTRNPVIMLDEIDKLGTDFRGDPASALLEVLDPEQNATFSDHYLEVPFDLSKVLFIATANVLDPIPPALQDRMEVIEVPGYVQEDKLAIARRYILPRQLERHGLSEAPPEMPDATLHAIIGSYTREAGLRNLEREIGKICRKLARKRVEEGKLPDAVTSEDLKRYLGPRRFEAELAGRVQIPGVSIGLAWTQAGGEILFIESTRMRGKHRLKITGSLGDVMRESVETAVALVRSRAHELGIAPETFEDDIHVHIPAGATRKDGPSAGSAIVTSLVSLLCDRPTPPDLAMTGEITLRGRILPVGGIKEKVLAAVRAGVRRVLLPVESQRDLRDIPESRLAGCEIIPVDTIDAVLRTTFGAEILR
jgi:ATP-dependent Lon protease